MDQSAGIVAGGLKARRLDARTQARAARRAIRPPAAGRYETPVWLERSFVLPVRDPLVRPAHHAGAPALGGLATDMPDQPAPRHEVQLFGASSSAEWPDQSSEFVRPTSPEIDFARLVRRTDVIRRLRLATLVAFFLGMLATSVYVLTGAGAALPLAAVSTLAGCLAWLWAAGSQRAPIPLLRG